MNDQVSSINEWSWIKSFGRDKNLRQEWLLSDPRAYERFGKYTGKELDLGEAQLFAGIVSRPFQKSWP